MSFFVRYFSPEPGGITYKWAAAAGLAYAGAAAVYCLTHHLIYFTMSRIGMRVRKGLSLRH